LLETGGTERKNPSPCNLRKGADQVNGGAKNRGGTTVPKPEGFWPRVGAIEKVHPGPHSRGTKRRELETRKTTVRRLTKEPGKDLRRKVVEKGEPKLKGVHSNVGGGTEGWKSERGRRRRFFERVASLQKKGEGSLGLGPKKRREMTALKWGKGTKGQKGGGNVRDEKAGGGGCGESSVWKQGKRPAKVKRRETKNRCQRKRVRAGGGARAQKKKRDTAGQKTRGNRRWENVKQKLRKIRRREENSHIFGRANYKVGVQLLHAGQGGHSFQQE